MRRVEIARKLALFARAAERNGNHGRAAELFAAALQALLRGSQAASDESLSDAGDADGGQAVYRTVPHVSASACSEEPAGSGVRATIAAASTEPIEGVTG